MLRNSLKAATSLIDFVRSLPDTLRLEVQQAGCQGRRRPQSGGAARGWERAGKRVCSYLLRMKDSLIAEQWCVTARQTLASVSRLLLRPQPELTCDTGNDHNQWILPFKTTGA